MDAQQFYTQMAIGIRLIEKYDNLKDSFHQFLEEHKVDLSS